MLSGRFKSLSEKENLMSGAREPRHDMTINSKPLGYFRRPTDLVAQVE